MSEALQRHIGPMPTWLMFSGATIGIVGASVTKHAESVGEFVVALDSRADTSNLAAAAPGRWGSGCLSSGRLWRSLGLLSQLALSNLRRRPPWSPPPTATCAPDQNASIFGPACKPTPRLARLAASAASTERVIITQPKLTLHGEIALWSSG
jgi:hypothetical protein